jgi:molybdopterin molybdotransferase
VAGAVTDWARARELAAAAVERLPPVTVGLAGAGALVLAQDAVAVTDLPATDTAAMDGWAVAGPPPWRPVGSVLAGQRWNGRLAVGQAVAIATGAELPNGAQAVLRREHARLDGHPDADGARLSVAAGHSAPVAGHDIRPAAQECRAGDVVLTAGSRLSPVALGLLAATGLDEVVVRRVSADVLVLGDELLTRGPARQGRLRDALGPLLSAWLPAWGCGLATRSHVPDTADALRLALSACRGDLVVTTGSTARGPVDHLHTVLADLGATLVVDGVDVRPGHPMLMAVLPDGRPVVGLPGNPLAAVSALLTLLQPVLQALLGVPPAPGRQGVLAVDVGAGSEATRLVPVRRGRPVLFAGPGMLRGLTLADAIAVIPPGGLGAGATVELLDLA